MTNNDDTTPGAGQVAPCPNCGSNNTHVWLTQTGTGDRDAIGCQDCGMAGPYAKTPDEAERVWDALPRLSEIALRQQLRQAEAEREQAKANELELAIELRELQQRERDYDSMQCDRNILQGEKDDLEASLSTLRAYLDRLAEERDTANAMLSDSRGNAQFWRGRTERLQAERDRLKSALEAIRGWCDRNWRTEIHDIVSAALSSTSTAAPGQSLQPSESEAPFGRCEICRHPFTENEHAHTIMEKDVFGLVCVACQEKRVFGDDSAAPGQSQQSGDGWISVEDRLPAVDDGQVSSEIVMVWAHTGDGNYFHCFASYVPEAGWAYRIEIFPSHWRHLPCPPATPQPPGETSGQRLVLAGTTGGRRCRIT